MTTPAAPTTVWAGGLGAFDGRDLGHVPRGPGADLPVRRDASRTTGAAADNAFAGASSTVALRLDGDGRRHHRRAGGPTPDARPRRRRRRRRPAHDDRVDVGRAHQPHPAGRLRRRAAASFRATLGWRKIKRKGNVFVKVRRTDFYVNAKRVRIDRKAPFVATFRIPLSVAGGRDARRPRTRLHQGQEGPQPEEVDPRVRARLLLRRRTPPAWNSGALVRKGHPRTHRDVLGRGTALTCPRYQLQPGTGAKSRGAPIAVAPAARGGRSVGAGHRGHGGGRACSSDHCSRRR